MSHFTKLDQAMITDAAAFAEVCRELGYDQVQEGGTIRDHGGRSTSVTYAYKKSGSRYEIALQGRDDGKYDMIADWWGVRGDLDRNGATRRFGTDLDLQHFLIRETTKTAIVSRYKKKGFRVEVEEDAQQNINIRMRRA